jgi:hypothetical protein
MPFLTSRGRTIFVVFVACLAWAGVARAESARLALIEPDRELERAVRVALSPWKTDVLAVRIAGPGSTMPGSGERARDLATQYAALAVVWVSKSEDGYALWMYDARDDRVVARRLTTPPPFDDANAAAVALAIKTLLRQSQVPPLAERAVEPLTDPLLSIFVSGGIRPTPTSPGATELRLGAGATVWPRFGLEPLSLGAGFEIASGPGISVDAPEFTGRWTETVLLTAAYARWSVVEQLDVSIEPGFGAGITVLSGNVSEPPEATTATRVNALMTLRMGIGYHPTRALRVGFSAGLVRPLRTQTYLVHGAPVLEAKPLTLECLLAVQVGLF